jgi:hypothetical protein
VAREPSRRPLKKDARRLSPWALTALVGAALVLGLLFMPRLRAIAPGSIGVARQDARPFTSPSDVFQQAEAARSRGELMEAYQILVRAVAQFPGDADVATAFGVSVNNTTYFVRPVRGRQVPVMATSLERVRAAHAALRAYERASAGRPALAAPYHYRGNLYAAWGLPDDALRELYQARVRGDSTASLLRTAAAILALQRGAMDPSLGGEIVP